MQSSEENHKVKRASPMRDHISSEGVDHHTAQAVAINTEIQNKLLRENQEKLRNLQSLVVQVAARQDTGVCLQPRDWLIIFLLVSLQTFLQYLVTR